MTEIQTNYVIKLVDLGILQVTGKKAAQFLQGQLTCDVTEVNENQSRLGAYCDVKGRIQATFRLFSYRDTYYFLLPRSMLSHLLKCLQKYAIFSAVNLVDVSQNWEIRGIVGATAANALNKHGLLPTANNETLCSDSVINLTIASGTPRFILVTSDKKLTSFIDTAFKELPVNDWHLLDIMAGIATIYPQTAAQFTPHQLNYPTIGGVSFSKGCYLGQEIIARTQYLGKSKSRLYRVSFLSNHDFLPGAVIQDEEHTRQGTLIMVAKEKYNHYQALACLQNQAISHTIHLEEGPKGPILSLLELPCTL